MSTISTQKPPIWFWIITIVALIWNILGVGAYFAQIGMTAEMMAELPQDMQDLYANLPSWYMIAYAVAVFGGALGCIALLLRKKWAYFLLLLSAIAAVIQMSYLAFGIKMANAMTPMIIIVSIGLVWFSKYATKKGWLS
ncbi:MULTISPECIES: hypothetical protein [unclassified Lacinutrix]|uniref:hypothetical protein n=1 Tax=unclassified Lacinutrix TaxID=2647285 RepID=UPI00020A3555|nr:MULTISPECIES: hypothetical protein [unclassified Lacinutrix]AEH02283.1 hypothetical protein Lacal_2441 [Lacinutrix sp. 5H-3-7-4]OIQ23884.1 MAG: hypothetical protein BM549_00840 [Lacinutrix sp. MedPE-SW]